MIKTFFILLFLHPAISQAQPSVTGSWQSVGNPSGNRYIFTFYPDGTYQQVIFPNNNADSFINEGMWDLKADRTLIGIRWKRSFHHGIEKHHEWTPHSNKSTFEVFEFNDSTLKLKVHGNYTESYTYHYHRISHRDKFKTAKFYLQYAMKPWKTIKLPENGIDITLSKRDTSCHNCYLQGETRYYGTRILSLKHDSIFFSANYFTHDSFNKAFSISYSVNLERDSVFSTSRYTRYYHYSLEFNSRNRNIFRSSGHTLLITGASTALVLAPLLSYNFSKGTFRTERYKKIAGAGLIGVGIGIPLSIIFRFRDYVLNTDPLDKNSNEWFIRECDNNAF